MSQLAGLVELESLVGVARIAFGGMMLVKLYFSFDAHTLVWAHTRPPAWLFNALRLTLVAATVGFTLGLFTGPAALTMWLLYLVLWRIASLFGMEDVSFHAVAAYFVFAGSGAALSLDSLLGTQVWGRIPDGTVIPEILLALALGNIFLSAGITKLPSPMWRSGLGTYYFFLLPNFRRLDTSWLTRHKPLMIAMNHVALAMELLLLPAMLLNAVPFGLAVWMPAFGFAVLLSTVFLLTWIGESLLIGLVIVAWLLLDTGTQGLATRFVDELALVNAPHEWLILALALVSLLAGLYVSLVFKPSWANWLGRFRFIDRWARIAARHTWGLIPCEVFTEVHMQGPVVFRVFTEHNDPSCNREVFRIFSDVCRPGKDRPFKPAFFEVTSYKVAEVCMEFDQWGEVRTAERERFLLQLAQHVRDRLPRTERDTLTSLKIAVLQVIPPDGYAGAYAGHLNADWVDALRVSFEKGLAVSLTALARGILRAPTGRRLELNTFTFDPSHDPAPARAPERKPITANVP